MIIYTSRYGNSKSVKAVDAVPVRTSVGAPRASFHYESVTELAPHGLLGLPHDLYRPRYLAKLDDLGPVRIRHLLAVAGGGRNVIVLCYENLLLPDSWCHRRIFAEWWEEKTGERVLELEDRVIRSGPKRKRQIFGHPVSKAVQEKAMRLNRDGKVAYRGDGVWDVQGDTAVYVVTEDRCSCPTGPELLCSHRLAVKMRDGGGTLFDS